MPQSQVRSLHDFFRRSLLYPLLLSTLLCAILFIGRVILAGSREYRFLVWNLFLAWIPYGLALWIVKVYQAQPRRRWKLGTLVVLWMLFLPNAPYIMTDFIHLPDIPSFPLMYDIALIFAFAWTGLLLGLTSLHLLERLVRGRFGLIASSGFVVFMTLLTGAGIYIGRFLRWNSWDIVARPGRFIGGIARALQNPFEHSHALGHIALFTTAILLFHLTFLAFRNSVRDSGRREV